MNRIKNLFTTKNDKILSIFFTAGYPKPGTVVEIITELEKNGADIIEIGIPYSDPLADGPVIQNSSHIALQNGMTLKKLLDEIKDIRETVKIPLLLMGYFNTVLRFGVDDFCKALQNIGIDGIILPDIPLEVYKEQYFGVFEKYGIEPVMLITPSTPAERIVEIDKLSDSFIYMVSSSSTTGAKKDFNSQNTDYFKRVADMKLKNPLLTGFGISDKQSFDIATKYSRGGIIGSAFINALTANGQLSDNIASFIKSIKQ